LHDRFEEHIDEQSCSEEIESFRAHGQRTAALGRPIVGDPDYDVEIICGARRLFVARHLGMKLLVKIREDLSDRDAIIAMHIDHLRKNVSPYERGMAYLRWLRGGYFGSQEEISAALRISASQVSRLLRIAKLPSVIVNAFGNAAEIRESWGTRLSEALEDPQQKAAAIHVARRIAADSHRPRPRDVYRRLQASLAPTSPGGRKVRATACDRVIEGADGTPLFRVRQQYDSIAILLPMEKTSARTLEAIQSAVAEILVGSAKRRDHQGPREMLGGIAIGNDLTS